MLQPFNKPVKAYSYTILVSPRRKGRFVKGETLTYHEVPGRKFSVEFIRYDGDKAFFFLDGVERYDYHYKLSR